MGTLSERLYAAKMAAAGRGVLRLSAELADSEVSSADEIARLQRRKSMAMALYAFRTTPFYNHLYSAAGFTESDLRHADVFDQLPRVSKTDLRHHGDEMRSTAARPSHGIPSTTGGSTGEPLTVLHDRRSPIAAMWRQVYRWWGVSPAENSAVIYRQVRSRRDDFVHRLQWWPTKQVQLDAWNMTPDALSAFCDEWSRVRPALLTGYLGGVLEFARFAAQTSLRLEPPRAIAVTAAPVTTAHRATIEAALAAPVYDSYRSAEVTWMAAECREQSGLHVLADVRVVECLGEDGRSVANGEIGEVTVTDLTNRVQPIIRYRMGDLTSPIHGLCDCGMGLPRIGPIEGRQSDALHGPGGRVVAGGLTGLFNHMPTAVSQFQIQQHQDMSITLVCVPTAESEAVDRAIQQAVARLAGLFDDQVRVDVVRVARIDHQGGKVRVVTSAVSSSEN